MFILGPASRWKTVCFFCIFLLSSCSGTGPSSDNANTLHYYQFSLPHDRQVFADLLDAFHREHPEIRVEVHSLPTTSDDQHQFYLTHAGARGKSRIDVMAVDVIWLAEFARAGLLMPVDSVLPPGEWPEFFAASMKAATYDGKRYAIPFFVDGGLLYSRKDLLEKYGYDQPPRTWDELIRMARNIVEKESDPELQGFVWQGKQYEGLICNFLEFISDDVQPLVVDTPQPSFNFNQAPIRKSLSLMSDLVFVHRVSSRSVFSMSEEESRHVFQNGKAVFMRNWPYAWRLAQQESSPVAGKIQVSPLPSVEEGGKSRAALGGFLLGIHPDTPYPEAARAWVRFMAGKPAQKILWETLGLTPARKTVFPELTPKGFPMDVLMSVMDSTVPRPVTPLYAPLSQSMQAYISGSLAGVYAMDESIRLIEEDARRIMRTVE